MAAEIADSYKGAATRIALANITNDQVASVLKESADLKALLKTVVSRITLDPGTLECQIHYQLPKWLCFLTQGVGINCNPCARNGPAVYGVPKGIRTPVAAVKGQCPRPLDDGDEGLISSKAWWS